MSSESLTDEFRAAAHAHANREISMVANARDLIADRVHAMLVYSFLSGCEFGARSSRLSSPGSKQADTQTPDVTAYNSAQEKEEVDVRERALTRFQNRLEEVRKGETKGARASRAAVMLTTHDDMQAARDITESVFGLVDESTVLSVYESLVDEYRYRLEGSR